MLEISYREFISLLDFLIKICNRRVKLKINSIYIFITDVDVIVIKLKSYQVEQISLRYNLPIEI